jgi:hypothetical protein
MTSGPTSAVPRTAAAPHRSRSAGAPRADRREPAARGHPAGAHGSGGRHKRAAARAVAANTTQLDFHVGRTEVHLQLPPPDKLAFYAGLAAVAALGVIDWPVAVLTGLGHMLTDDRHNRTLRALGEALDSVA